jgi:hypothetical protein
MLCSVDSYEEGYALIKSIQKEESICVWT